jgi:cell division control protein 7
MYEQRPPIKRLEGVSMVFPFGLEMEVFEHEISDFKATFPDCRYDIVEKIGQGTFSSVYKAIDVEHDLYDNSQWCEEHKEGSECRYVALKRIYASSSPSRIYSEMALLHTVSHHPNIASLITALRHEDQVVVVLPYFEHDSFKSFYRKLPMDQIKSYMYCILSALECVHQAGYIHRDIKPSNFLYRVDKRHGVLIDFGLAQPEPKPQENKYRYAKQNTLLKTKKPGYLLNDTRPSIRASRAGTRGFRAPEVLFKVVYQTCAIDIWSVGVILLSFFTGQFPFFQSEDDTEALLEIAHIFGKDEMTKIAHTFSTSN